VEGDGPVQIEHRRGRQNPVAPIHHQPGIAEIVSGRDELLAQAVRSAGAPEVVLRVGPVQGAGQRR
jgi:hypothetical protein